MQQWFDLCSLDDVPFRGSRIVTSPDGDIAIFKTQSGRIFALRDKCPHKGGPLSQGIVHDDSVTCPLHNWVVNLETGDVKAPDQGCARRILVEVENNRIRIDAAVFEKVAA
jgi:nitrite reductase (NADH) small subunit